MNYTKNENLEETQENNVETKKLKYNLIKLVTIIVENIIKDTFTEELLPHLEVLLNLIFYLYLGNKN